MAKLKRYDLYEGDDDLVSTPLPGKQPLGRDEGLKARDVVEIMGCSRRLAELRFREVTGKSILEEIRRVRYENARLLLSQADVPMDVVANRSGWASLPSFCREFKELTGLTPAEWRRKSSSEA